MLSESLGNQNSKEDEQPINGTPNSSCGSGRIGLLPAFGLRKLSHLPTPQSSPSNAVVYAEDLNGSYASPVSKINRDAQMPYMHVTSVPTPPREDVRMSQSFITPESSPMLPRKMMPPASPIAGSSSTPRTPIRGFHERSDTRSVTDHSSNKMSVDTSVQPLAPAPIITTPVSAHSSRLSSPFQDRLSVLERRDPKSMSKSPILAQSPVPDVFSAVPSSSPPPLMTPVPQRALGGEIQRIHLQLAADRAEHMAEMEARRPEYFRREKRPYPDADIPTLDELDAENAVLGVTESPMKGRRLQLFQATSEETFEQSLLAGGYPGYGQSPAYKNGEPQTPLPNGKGRSALSQRALQWLQQATPGQPGPSSTATTVETAPSDEPDWVPSEKEIRKRRRLDAFRDHPERRETATKLYAVEVEGRGRLLLNVPPEGPGAHHVTPMKKRTANRRKKRRGGRRGYASDPQEDHVVQPNWLDASFPWCVRLQERTHAQKMEQEERLKWIERFLERESDSDLTEEDQELRPPLQSHDNDQVAHRRGRGKMVPLRANPDAARRTVKTENENVMLPSDPADARAALLSKRSVRTLATRRKEALDDEVDEVKCIGCNRGDDGNELVQCDECKTWYHLPCIGIRNVAELGREEDPWFCDRCLDIKPASPLEPTFVPTDDRPLDPSSRRDSLFLQNPLLESPAPHWDAEPAAPQTPVRGGEHGQTQTLSTRSSWGESSSRAGPSTPGSSAKTVRVYNTPGPFATAFDRDGFDPETPFDPTTTPSRGIKFSGGPPPTLGLSTPKGGLGLGLWGGHPGLTPTPAKFGGPLGAGALGRHGWEDGTSPSYARSIYSAAYDDTPVTRAPWTRERLAVLNSDGRRLWESPGLGFARPGTPSKGERKRQRGADDDGEREREVVMETEA